MRELAMKTAVDNWRYVCEPAEKAGSRIRTDDLLITNQLLYQLSYAGILLGKLSHG